MTGLEGTPLGAFMRDTSKNFKERPADCSAEAAASSPGYKARVRREVLNALREAPRSACELARQLGHDILSVRPRISDLLHDGLIEKVEGERRKTPSGKSEAVWTTITDSGRQALQNVQGGAGV